jgi:subtilase family serine protease
MMEGVANVWTMKTVPLAQPMKPREAVEIKSRALNYSMHQWTGVNKLHREGIRGKGAKVAIIDTGIDYTHKAVRSSVPRFKPMLTLSARRMFWPWLQSLRRL